MWQQPTLMETTTLCLRVVPYTQQATRRDRCCSKSRSRCSLIMASTVLMQSCITDSHSLMQLPGVQLGTWQERSCLKCRCRQLQSISFSCADAVLQYVVAGC